MVDSSHFLRNYKKAIDEHSLVSTTDVKGVITFANDKFCAISGYSRGELMGKDHKILNSDTHKPVFFKDLWKTLAQGQTWKGDICNRSKQGHEYWVQTTIVPLKNMSGKISQYVSIRTDITAKVQMAGDLDRSNGILEQQADQLNAERIALTNKNIALREIIDHVEQTKKNLESNIRQNFEHVVMPVLQKMQNRSEGVDAKYLALLRNSLKEIVQPFLQGGEPLDSLSPKEILVCSMIRNGQSTKEIAEMLTLSPRTIDKHRENIRKKLNLDTKKINLTSYLMHSQ